MKGLAFLVCLLVIAPCVWALEDTSLEVAGVVYRLQSSGELSLSPPKMASPIPLPGRFATVFEISGRVFAKDPGGAVYLVVPPRPRGFLSRQLTTWINRYAWFSDANSPWWGAHVPKLISMADLVVDGRRIQLADFIDGLNGPDVILRSFFDRYSLREILRQVDSESGETPSVCAQLLNPRGR